MSSSSDHKLGLRGVPMGPSGCDPSRKPLILTNLSQIYEPDLGLLESQLRAVKVTTARP
ncbi:uncharacterized protein G2W53_022255 [Senna tora]|uniref:Uncharacterized protein n=1 Tax=Senna tora TaxID=362788 RepID=A0A834TND3_9FABA|nr:uncharacterized protein G2W53_022255 [Senna tora]